MSDLPYSFDALLRPQRCCRQKRKNSGLGYLDPPFVDLEIIREVITEWPELEHDQPGVFYFKELGLTRSAKKWCSHVIMAGIEIISDWKPCIYMLFQVSSVSIQDVPNRDRTRKAKRDLLSVQQQYKLSDQMKGRTTVGLNAAWTFEIMQASWHAGYYSIEWQRTPARCIHNCTKYM